MQFPWCTVSFGRSAGCCDGKGGEELCLEQHITPDVGFAMQQFYRATGDKAWLAEIGFPIAQGVAEWVVSRVKLGARQSITRTVLCMTLSAESSLAQMRPF